MKQLKKNIMSKLDWFVDGSNIEAIEEVDWTHRWSIHSQGRATPMVQTNRLVPILQIEDTTHEVTVYLRY